MRFDVFLERPHDGSPEGRERLARALGDHYRIDAEVFRKAIVAGRRLRVKANIDERTARGLARELEQFGALVSVSAHGEPRPSKPVPAIPTTDQFTLVSLDGEDPDNLSKPVIFGAADAPSAFMVASDTLPAPEAPLAPGPAVPKPPVLPQATQPPAPRPPPADAFAPPPDSEQPLELATRPARPGTLATSSPQPVSANHAARREPDPPAPEPEPLLAAPQSSTGGSAYPKSKGVRSQEASSKSLRSALPAAGAQRSFQTPAASPQAAARAPIRPPLTELALRDPRGRLVAALGLGLLLGFVPAHIYASFAEDKLDDIGAQLARQPPPQTEAEYQIMLEQFALAERRAERVKTRILIVTALVWLVAGGGLAYGYWRFTEGLPARPVRDDA